MIAETDKHADLLAFIRKWFLLLAEGRGAVAIEMIDEPNCYGIKWSLELINAAVDMAFPAGCRFRSDHPGGIRISDPDLASGKPHPTVWALKDGSGYGAVLDVPLNGEWSDLAAEFEFRRRKDGLAVILHDLHVL